MNALLGWIAVLAASVVVLDVLVGVIGVLLLHILAGWRQIPLEDVCAGMVGDPPVYRDVVDAGMRLGVPRVVWLPIAWGDFALQRLGLLCPAGFRAYRETAYARLFKWLELEPSCSRLHARMCLLRMGWDLATGPCVPGGNDASPTRAGRLVHLPPGIDPLVN